MWQVNADAQTVAFNAQIEQKLREYSDAGPQALCDLLCQGDVLGTPPSRMDEVAEDITVSGPHGSIPLRLFVPEEVHGVYLHFHGGGWVSGSHATQDDRLWARAQAGKMAVLSVGYRLAPAHPYPVPNDDCEAAAMWLLENSRSEFGTERLVIGGESAGAHLAVVTLLRLRDKLAYVGFRAANLTYGVFDLRLSPSSRNWGERPLVLTTPLLQWYVDQYAPPDGRDAPDVSPLFAPLRGMPAAMFTVGTEDPLLDDTLFMAARWRAAGNQAVLRVYSGAAHGFDAFPIPVGREATAAITDFLRQELGHASPEGAEVVESSG